MNPEVGKNIDEKIVECCDNDGNETYDSKGNWRYEAFKKYNETSENKQEEKDTSWGYKVCYILMTSCVLCTTAIIIALTLRFIQWILF